MRTTHTKSTGNEKAGVYWSARVNMAREDQKRVLANPGNFIEGWEIADDVEDGIILVPKKNLVVKVGVARSLDRLFNISGGTGVTPLNSLTQEVIRIGIDDGTTNPTADSISSNNGGGADTGSTNQTLRTFDSPATRSGLVVTASGTFNDPTTGGIGAVSFVQKRLFLSAHNLNVTDTTSSDADNTLYSMTNVFTIDFTGIPTWSAVYAAEITGAGT